MNPSKLERDIIYLLLETPFGIIPVKYTGCENGKYVFVARFTEGEKAYAISLTEKQVRESHVVKAD